ncbi:hypothetical protein [Pseudomonas virus PBPA162]|uniref:Uncharacterized protein n=1 Tax=Pseudomonas virus PBPA162 TaxID=2588096 RepID=A0A4Y5TPC4_9CAUD|nr:hypothetical protein PQC32_gp55 [Pseudomonas virus PBPA162]QDB70889.1 hypothetical protein [Pseudomonas virus PBPA162]
MNQLAETIKLGMLRALQTEQLRHMCVHVMAVADHRGISYTNAFNFMYWVERTIGPYKDAMQYLCQHHPDLEMERRKLFGTDEERRRPIFYTPWRMTLHKKLALYWCNLYVWAYYDLVKRV